MFAVCISTVRITKSDWCKQNGCFNSANGGVDGFSVRARHKSICFHSLHATRSCIYRASFVFDASQGLYKRANNSMFCLARVEQGLVVCKSSNNAVN